MHEAHEDHFESFEQQAHAAELGMWVFLASEILLFTSLFALYASYRIQHPTAFAEGVAHNARLIGSINTGVLLVSSYLIARSIPSARSGRRAQAAILLGGTFLLGLVFLTLKTVEYASHFREGILPGGDSDFFQLHGAAGLPTFFNLYYLMTGAHALHVVAGLAVITWLFGRILGAREPTEIAHPLEVGAMYWHLVDIVWIFLWPLFYLAGGGTK